jgi:hypothetical protein
LLGRGIKSAIYFGHRPAYAMVDKDEHEDEDVNYERFFENQFKNQTNE